MQRAADERKTWRLRTAERLTIQLRALEKRSMSLKQTVGKDDKVRVSERCGACCERSPLTSGHLCACEAWGRARAVGGGDDKTRMSRHGDGSIVGGDGGGGSGNC